VGVEKELRGGAHILDQLRNRVLCVNKPIHRPEIA
jgi:hypothetical protein